MKKYFHKLQRTLTLLSLLALVVSQAGLQSVPLAGLNLTKKAQAQLAAPVITIGGMKWEDLNGNGVLDSGEPGVQGVQININQLLLADAPSIRGLFIPTAHADFVYSASTVTDSQGNYSFTDVPLGGSYDVCETVPSGWHQTFPINANNNCHRINLNLSETESVTGAPIYDFGNQRNQATIVVDKIVCPNESDLPNWGDHSGGPIDANTAAVFLREHKDCHLASGWSFQWAFNNVENPGDQTATSSDLTTFGPTDGSGRTSTQVVLGDKDEIRVREVFQSGYIPFTGASTADNVSAEIYCNDDVLNYDNYDYIRGASVGNTYYCVAWNVAQLPAQQCGNGQVEGTEVCDEGTVNGQPLHCNLDCSGNTLPVCGNQITESDPYGAEQCDDGNLNDGDGCSSTCQQEQIACHSPLDYVNTEGVLGPDHGLTLSDAVIFTQRYEAALGSHTGDGNFDATVDVNNDGAITAADYLCTRPYYAANGPYTCQLDCNNICVNPLDYDQNYQITLSDGTEFTNYYENKTYATSSARYLADLNGNGGVDYGDYLCSYDQLAMADYQCPIKCASVCGDGTIQPRLGETCDDGNHIDFDGCSSFCQTETNECQEPNKLDYNHDYQFTGGDAVIFTSFYEADNSQADVNNDGLVDYGDKLCANKYYSAALAYVCDIVCPDYTPVCGDTHIDEGEQCDDGNTTNGDGCNSRCQNEQLMCVGTGTYTLDADFDKGTLINVVHTPSDQLQLSSEMKAFNFIWVAVSTKGTVVKINTDTGAIMGEYATNPASHGWGQGNPSRTTVDKDGSVWLTNRNDVYEGVGSVIHIGLVENNQCQDRNGNGLIDTSTAQNDIKPWTTASVSPGVGTAEDECIIHYVKLPNSSGTRHVSVTANNDVWVAGLYSRNFDLVKGGGPGVPGSGTIIRSESSVGYGGYGGLITPSGVIWSSNPLMRWDTSVPLVAGNFLGYGHDSYGLCIDPSGNVWNTSLSGDQIRKFAPDGSLLGTFGHGSYYAQGCAAAANGDIWVAGSLYDTVVGHLKNNGTLVGTVSVPSGPTGIAVDANGKVWSTNYNAGNVTRIDPLGGAIGGDGVTPIGSVDLTTVGLGGNPYNYSDMTGSTLSGSATNGTWTVIHDGEVSLPWGSLTWTATGSLTVTVATSEDGSTFGAPQTITSGQDLSSLTSRYLKIVVAFEREVTGASPILYDLTVNRLCDQPPAPSCGNSVIDEGEQCDEGEVNGQPGHCNSQCSGITEATCGNTIVEAGEQCDDGNINDGDGCSASCQSEQNPPTPPPTPGPSRSGGGGGGGMTTLASLLVAKTASLPFVSPGSQVTFTISVTNNGNVIATNVSLDDSLPAGFTFADGGGTAKTWTWDTIGVGQTVTVSYLVNVSSTASLGVYSNTAVVKSNAGIVSAQGSVNVEVRSPQVLGVETEVPASAEKVKVLGFEALPDTSGDWSYLGIFGALIVMGLSIFYGRKAFQD
ncbi:MAG: DUF4215 domain-containing protein [Candidatus Komeilibacteria bacterium]